MINFFSFSNFYTDLRNSDDYKIPKITIGLTVAAYDDGKWYRGEISQYSNGPEVFVLLVDFSIHKSIKIDDLRYLEKSFATPCRKLLPGGLFGIKPKEGEAMWSVDSIICFKTLTNNAKLSAVVKAYKNGFYELLLINQNCQRISDIMIERGFADRDDPKENNFNAYFVSQ